MKYLQQLSVILLCLLAINATGQIERVEIEPTVFFSPASIYALGEASDGGILISGDYQYINGNEQTGLIKVLDDGGLDPEFQHGFADVRRIRVKDDGNLVVATTTGVFELDPNGELIDGLYNAEFGVEFDLLSDGQVIILDYNSGNTTNNVLLIDAQGDIVDDFTVDANAAITSVAASDNYVYVFGYFTSINGHQTSSVGRLTFDGSVDENYTVSTARGFDRFGNVTFDRYFLQGDTLYYPSSGFTQVQRILEDGSRDENYSYQDPATNNGKALWADAAGVMIDESREILRTTEDGTVDASFASRFVKGNVDVVFECIRLSSGEYLLGYSDGSVEPFGLVRLTAEGDAVSMDFQASIIREFGPFTIRASGDQFYVGGRFGALNGDSVRTNTLVRFNADGQLDPSFDAGVSVQHFGFVNDLQFGLDGQLWVQASQWLLRLNTEGDKTLFGLEDDLIENITPYFDRGVIISEQNTYKLLDENDEVDPSFALPINAPDLAGVHVLPDTSLLVLFDENGGDFEINLAKVTKDYDLDADFDLDIRGSYTVRRMDEENFFAYVFDGDLTGDVTGDFAKFDLNGNLDEAFVANYNGPSRLNKIRRFQGKYIFLSTNRVNPVHVTDLEGNHLGDFSARLNEQVLQTSITDFDVFATDTLLFVGDNVVDAGAITKVYVNRAPQILETTFPESISEDTLIRFNIENVVVEDLNHTTDKLTFFALPGENYTATGDSLLLDENYFGPLSFEVVVVDPSNASDTVAVTLEVTPVNDVPVVLNYQGESTFDVNSTFPLTLADFVIQDPDNNSADFSLTVLEGENYQVGGANISPLLDFEGNISVGITVSDGLAESDMFIVDLTIETILSSEWLEESGINLYPNPAQDFVTIDLGPEMGNDVKVSFYDLAGYLLETHVLNPSNGEAVKIPLNYSTQVLLVTFESEEQFLEQRLLYVK